MQSNRHEAIAEGFYRTATAGIGGRKPAVGLRMTPMIDVIFLLLTFFVLTAQFQEPEQFLPILLGQNEAQTASVEMRPIPIHIKVAPDGCAVSVAEQSKIRVRSEDPAEGILRLTQNIRNTIETGDSGAIELYCEDAVSWDLVVKIYDVLYTLGARNITFRIEE